VAPRLARQSWRDRDWGGWKTYLLGETVSRCFIGNAPPRTAINRLKRGHTGATIRGIIDFEAFAKKGISVAVKFELSQKLVDGLSFNKQIVGLTDTDRPIFDDTPEDTHDWVIRDGGKAGVSGLLLRVTPGAMTWCVRRKMKGTSKRLAMASARKIEGQVEEVLTLADARGRAYQWLKLMKENIDPRAIREQHLKESRMATDQRRLTMAVAFAEFIEAKRKHKTKLGDSGKLEVGVGKRRTLDPKLRDASTADRIKVQRWMTGSPMWHVPVKDLTEELVDLSLTPLLRRAAGARPKITWGPKSVSKGTMDKIYVHLDGAWWRASNLLKQGVTRDEGPLRTWRQAHDSDWPGERRVETALDTRSEEHVVWLKALMEMQKAAHDPAVYLNRADPRGKEIKPHLGVLVDFYLLLILWGTRQTETMLLEWTMVDFNRSMVSLSADTTKSGARDVVPLTPWAAQILRERQRLNELWRPDAPGRYVFPSRERGHPISSPRGVLVALAETTGVALTAHDLRRSMARELGSDEELLHTARLLVSGAALHHGAGRGGSRVAASTERYLGDRAEILRPLYQKREDTLRKLVGLPVASVKSGNDTEADNLLAKVKSDPAFKARLLEALLKG